MPTSVLTTALHDFTTSLHTHRPTVTAETGHYAALKALLNAVGDSEPTPVHAREQLANDGAGSPDFGLFAADQPDGAPRPARGAVEVKPPDADLRALANTDQVRRYTSAYGQTLITNMRAWGLVTRDGGLEEHYELAPSDAAFWRAIATADGRKTFAAAHAAPLEEFLRRAMRRPVPITTPRDVAAWLASYARQARALLITNPDDPVLGRTRANLEGALGLTFDPTKKDSQDFFVSSVVQTLFYGVFAAWVLWHERNPAADTRFNLWRDVRSLSIPAIRELFPVLSDPNTTQATGVSAVLERAAEMLGRVDRGAFFAAFGQGQAVQYFYEPFLEQFDPALREQLGVWYTPPQVVDYMVARVDHALIHELDIPDGLADDSVMILDPCCGTGAYLVGVLHAIYNRLVANGHHPQEAARRVRTALTGRVHGFELLPAPFVVAHLQLMTLLAHWGAPLDGRERAAVYLTNALTGWAANDNAVQGTLLADEQAAANEVKRRKKVLVVLGNPPYNGYAGAAMAEERTMVDVYRAALPGLPRPQGQGLNDLYVRFIRLAERRIANTGHGVVCTISNSSWLDGLSHPTMRHHLLQNFDSITVDNLNGDKFRTGKTTPDGAPDPSIFSTESNREGIQPGTAIATMVRRPDHTGGSATIHYRDLWGTGKLAQLKHDALALPPASAYVRPSPAPELGLPFAPRAVSEAYLSWPTLPELFPTFFPGVNTARDSVLVDNDRGELEARMRRYFDPNVSDSKIAREMPPLMQNSYGFASRHVRTSLLSRGFRPEYVTRYVYRPFDVRWLYWEQQTKLLDAKRSDMVPHIFSGNTWFTTQQKPRRAWTPPGIMSTVGSYHLEERGASCVPMLLAAEEMFTPTGAPVPNLSVRALEHLAALGMAAEPEAIFYHALAVQHAPAYLAANQGALMQGWPRVPLPPEAGVLRASAALGRRVAALLNTEAPVRGVTHGPLDAAVRGVAVRTGDDLTVSASWGHHGSGNAVMAGRGKVTDNGDGTVDVWLNASTRWQHVPRPVWDYTLGGYQVLKKWLSYRDVKVLGRPLREDEAQHFTDSARRIAALLALAPSLDANYEAVG